MERILGIDYGVKRIGLAQSDLLGMTAQPLKVIEHRSTKSDIEEIGRIVKENGITKAVIGLPLNMDGTPGHLTDDVKKFGDALHENLGLTIEYFDERMTTMQADRMLIEEADMSREKRKGIRDKIAASYILQAYLDSRQ